MATPITSLRDPRMAIRSVYGTRMTNTTTRGTMGTKTTKIRIGTTFTRYGGGYPDNIATVVERQRGRRGDASSTMYVLADSSGERREAIGRETLLRLMGR